MEVDIYPENAAGWVRSKAVIPPLTVLTDGNSVVSLSSSLRESGALRLVGLIQRVLMNCCMKASPALWAM